MFAILSALVAEHAGLHYDSSHSAGFGDRVAARAVEKGFESLLDYYYFLRYDPGGREELDALVENLVVGETYFFRELAPLEMMVSEIIVPIVAEGRRPRIWCAASSTGEEPLTIAMLLASRGVLEQVDLVASDLSTSALERARSGRFSPRSIRQEVPGFAARWLDVTQQGVFVRERLIEAVEWRRINLLDDVAVSCLGAFDVVLCRNALIYFSDAITRKVVARLGGVLRPEGVLLVGIAESLLRFSVPLVCEERSGVFLYRKPS